MSKAPKTTKAIRDFFLDEDPPRTAQAPRSAKSPKRQASRGSQKPSVPLLPADERYLLIALWQHGLASPGKRFGAGRKAARSSPNQL